MRVIMLTDDERYAEVAVDADDFKRVLDQAHGSAWAARSRSQRPEVIAEWDRRIVAVEELRSAVVGFRNHSFAA
jgi:hypothetical protein